MNERTISLAVGALLHDFGKLLYRNGDKGDHSSSGYECLKETPLLKDRTDILDCVRYHHSKAIRNAAVSDDAICYAAYIADNIASCADRRAKEDAEGGFVRDIASETVFNILNGNNENKVYPPSFLDAGSKVIYPQDDPQNIHYHKEFYSRVVENILDQLKGIELTREKIDSLLLVLEAELSYIPSSTQTGELRDISLYEHLNITEETELCIEKYLAAQCEKDYRSRLYTYAAGFYDEKVFALYSLDISGIQSFIYDISSKAALKGLRARSFYLEMILEDIADELLERLGLCRVNVLYTGGGHTYLLLPADSESIRITNDFGRELNEWFINTFGNSLYAASGYTLCSANDLKNMPEGSYRRMFREVSRKLSEQKRCRYTASDIIRLRSVNNEGGRECRICHRSDRLSEGDICTVCAALTNTSDALLRNAFFAVEKGENGLPLPFGRSLTTHDADSLKKLMTQPQYLRSYSKNAQYTGENISYRLWVGDYPGKTVEFSELVQGEGIKRLGVIRADVDNLGNAFVNGFSETGGGKYETLSRTATFSRKLSEFFKLRINHILSNGEFSITKTAAGARKAAIVYSGGDDLFVVGKWDDIIGFSVDLHNCLEKYAQGTLTVSAGIGIYDEKFPIYAMAGQTGDLEDAAKAYNNNSKNAVALFDKDNVYSWDDLIERVIKEKLTAIRELTYGSEHDTAMLYKMLELVKNGKEKLNIARFAYLLARMRPKDSAPAERKQAYEVLSERLYRWIKDEEDRRHLITAIYIYVYCNRGSTPEEEE